jgi:cation diffusion facilitator family transporter
LSTELKRLKSAGIEPEERMTTPIIKAEEAARRGVHSSILGIIINLLLAATKCLAGFVGHSFALVADGIESMSDVVSSSVVAFGLWWAIRPPDKDHPYGHGKAEPIAAIVVSFSLVGAAIAIAVQSVSEIRTPHRLPEAYTLPILLGVVLVKVFFSRYVSSIAGDIESTAVRADAWHHISDAILSGFAFVGISIGLLTKNATADDWAALCASPIILFSGLRQMRAPIAELLDTAPSTEIESEVRRVAAAVPGVAGLEKCFVRKVGFRHYVDLHVIVDGNLTVRQGHAIAHEVKDSILQQIPRIAEVLVHVEPE